MKNLLLVSVFLTSNAFAGVFADCNEADSCTFKNCSAQVVESVGNTAMATCREVYKKGVFAYHEIKILAQHIDEDTKKSTVIGNTIRLK